ncbi:protein kinase domain-containing protein [Haliangium sp.]|uniref:protein kinase domain-containing protein n=1 Tax=Haliangium sp. TaxID=2663208 RepID=UPI003D0F8914
MSKEPFWNLVRGWFGAKPEPPRLPASAPVDAPSGGTDEERWLDALIADVGQGKRVSAVASEGFWERITALWQGGRELLAIEWLEKYLSAPATPEGKRTELRLALVELLDKRADLAAAVPHLDHLSRIEAHATYAHYLLGEHYRRQGDERRALRHYEAVLARDVTYPNVRERVERLRRARGQDVAAVVGETIAGSMAGTGGARYTLVRELGRGATGVVYLARDGELTRDVAIKLLHPHLAAASRADACARFFREARTIASLRHPNIVAVLDLDEQARRIVMELGAGGTLRQVLRERGPRPLLRALERHAQILSALAASHRRGIVHRDLKPGNLMFRRDPDAPGAEIMLGDFGVAHLPDAAGATGAQAAEARKPAEAVGTLAYMAPEQRRGAPADPRSDLYSAAVVLFEMLTGTVPWPAEILLAGTRARADLRLPEAPLAGVSRPFAEAVQAHLDRLGDPILNERPDTIDALAEAHALRDRAVAESPAQPR